MPYLKLKAPSLRALKVPPKVVELSETVAQLEYLQGKYRCYDGPSLTCSGAVESRWAESVGIALLPLTW